MKRMIGIVLMTSILLTALSVAALPVAASVTDLPQYPDSNPYWFIFYDESLDNIVLMTGQVELAEGQELQLSWGSYLKTLDPVTVIESAAYSFGDGSWEPLYGYEPPQDYVQRVVAGNVNVYDNLGNIYSVGMSYREFLNRVAQAKENTKQALQNVLGEYNGSYTAPQGNTGLTLSVYDKQQLLTNTTLLSHYAHIASFCSVDADGMPQRIFSAEDVKNIISACSTSYVALFNFYPLTADSGVEEGLYVMSVDYDIYTGTYDFVGEQWIQHDTYQMADLRNVRLIGDQLSGGVWGEYTSWLVTEYMKVGEALVERGTDGSGYRIEFVNDTIEVEACDTQELKVTVKNSLGDTLQTHTDILWSSSDPQVARVKGASWGESGYEYATAIVTGASAGEAIITAQLPNGRMARCTVTVTGDGYLEAETTVAVFSTEKSLCLKTGDSMRMAFSTVKNGEIEPEWKRMTVSVSDPEVLTLSRYQKTKQGYVLDVKGMQKGKTYLTVTDPETGASTVLLIGVYDVFANSYSYHIENVPTFYPPFEHDAEIETNIYNLNGLYVNNYRAVKGDGGQYYVSFDAYNAKYHIAAVDIFDANGEWVNSVPIDKFSDMTSLWQVGEQVLVLWSDAKEGKWATYEQKTYSKKTQVQFEVPAGGHFRITNNMRESIGVALYNAFDLLYTSAAYLMSPVDKPEETVEPGEFYELLKKSFEEDPTLRKELIKIMGDTFKEELVKLGKNATMDTLDESARSLFNFFEDVLRQMGIDWKKVGEGLVDDGEKLFEKFAGPVGDALKCCFSINKVMNFHMQLLNFLKALDDPYVTIHTSIENGYISPQGVVVQTGGNVDAEAVLQVFRIDAVGTSDGLPSSADSDALLYNICFVKNDELVQPSGTVKVYIPIPDGMKRETCTVYRQEEDGFWMPLEARVEGEYLVFETEHFSLYAVSGDSMELTLAALPVKLEYQVGELLNTDGLKLMYGSKEIASGFICDPCVLSEAGTQQINVRYGNSLVSYQVIVKAATETTPDEENNGSQEPPADTSDDAKAQDGQDQPEKKERMILFAIIIAEGMLILLLLGIIIKKRK